MGAWRTVRVADVAAPGANSMATGPFGSSISSRFFRTSGVPVIRGGNLSTDSAIRLSDENLVFLDPGKAAEFSRSTVGRGDLIFTCWGTINQVGLIDESAGYDRYVISNKQMKLTPDPSTADSEFLYYLFSAPPMQREILEGSIGSSIPGFNLTRLRSLEIELPPLGEQKRIAEALSDAEGVEARLFDTIAKKQAIKQGMMQQMFALPVRNGDRALLGSITSFLSGGTPDRSNAEYWIGTIPWISATTLKSIEVSSSNQHVSRRAVNAGSKMAPLSSTLLLVRGSALHSEIRASLVTAPVCFNQDVKALVPHSTIVPKFLTYSMHANAAKLLALVTSAGNTAGVLDTNVLKAFELWVPSRERQAEVIAVLDDVARELDLLQARLDKAREVKQGMMQELLTGRTRLPVAEAVT